MQSFLVKSNRASRNMLFSLSNTMQTHMQNFFKLLAMNSYQIDLTRE